MSGIGSVRRVIDRFLMTSRRPYWCSKTKKRQSYWCTKPILRELNSIFMVAGHVSGHLPYSWGRCRR